MMTASAPLSSIEFFCQGLMLSPAIAQAFKAYAKKIYADDYQRIAESVTMEIAISRMREDRLEDLWKRFVIDLKAEILEREAHSHAENQSKFV